MIQITNQYLNEEFIKSINYLSEKEVNIQVAVKLEKMLIKLSDALKSKNESEAELVNKYAIKDEDGNFVLAQNEDGETIPNSYNISNESIEDYKKDYANLMNETHEIDIDKIHMSELADTKISAKNFSYLKPLFHL